MSKRKLGETDRIKSKLKILTKFNAKTMFIWAAVFSAIGVALLVQSYAASPSVMVEAESGQITSPATEINDSNASNSKAVKFGVNSSTSACLTRPLIMTLSGNPLPQFRTQTADDSGIDARNGYWTSNSAGDYPVYFDYSPTKNHNLCWQGGHITGNYNESTTAWDTYHGITAMRVRVPNFIVDGLRVHNSGDGIGFSDDPDKGAAYNSEGWTIRNVRLSHIHDDCVENDYMHNGLVEDSLLEGCYSGLSARGHSGQSTPPDGRANTMTIRNSLVFIEKTPTVYKGATPGHGPLFKWPSNGNEGTDGFGTMLSVHNSIFRIDQAPNHGDIGIPTYKNPTNGANTSYLKDCSNNTIVWLGSGPYPATMPSCFTITTNKAVWDNAVAAWQQAHPGIPY